MSNDCNLNLTNLRSSLFRVQSTENGVIFQNFQVGESRTLAGWLWDGLQYFNIIIYKDANLNFFCGIENRTLLETQIYFQLIDLIQLKRIPGQPMRHENLVHKIHLRPPIRVRRILKFVRVFCSKSCPPNSSTLPRTVDRPRFKDPL